MGEAGTSKIPAELISKLSADPGTPVPDPTVSFWQEPVLPFADQQSPTLAESADVVILGSGITAISTAQHLLRLDASLKIVILEARRVLSGATGRNGGHIKAVPVADYMQLKKQLGRESAMKITRFRLAHLDAFVKEAELLGEAGEAGLVRRVEACSGYYDKAAWETAKSNREGWLQDFPEERERWTIHEQDSELKEMGLVNAYGALRGPAGAAWPYRFVGAVLSQLLATGQVMLETHTPATGVRRTTTASHPYQVETRRGIISTKHVVHCTNAFAAHLLPALRGKLYPLRGQMTVQSVPDDFPRSGAKRSWSTIWARGFDYITQSPGPDGSLYLGGGLLQGGWERDRDIGNTDDSQLSAQCLEHLEQVPGKAFLHGQGAQIDKKWTGIMGFTGDDLPFVDRLASHVSGREECEAGSGGEWIAAGFNGYGMVHSWLSGKALASMIQGREDEILDWFPREEFACTEKRLQGMTPEGALSRW
ncbi:hypothetical protein PV10_00267 [Exophiala mesophila]|uniref:FAD dependent oxidoreductase domain-containing protein n=1 Tax=Exophiala mesophila TaxID=212818 RepID=A0A0D1ZQZ2_EXOME|nr:uncharacterized protein PV10_00267 [Exophiala mesophila]KIV96389.1 hypothetical protein PV10_00267 [Exophiala mesophila]